MERRLKFYLTSTHSYPADVALRFDLDHARHGVLVAARVGRVRVVGDLLRDLCVAPVGDEHAADAGDCWRAAVVGEHAALEQTLHLVVADPTGVLVVGAGVRLAHVVAKDAERVAEQPGVSATVI